ncbi:MAG: carbamate kinase [Phycisphaerae bacterium]|nr:carbamate kinase [Phycisphaerae bacterium]
MKLVVALGGNALSAPGEVGDIDDQFRHTTETVHRLADLIGAGHTLLITHGNGPQIGSIMRRVEIAARQNIYPIPMTLAVADTQGGMGYMISQCLMNELASRGRWRLCSTLITTTEVDPDDPAFRHPSKPIGPFYTRQRAEEHRDRDGWTVVEDAGRGWRRVVASPKPISIVEMPVIARLIDAGELVVACGGGGIPVVRTADGRYRGRDAVIDKDRTAALLALGIDADALIVLTGVERVCVKFGTPAQRAVDRMTTSEAAALMEAGEFPEGSMGPKIEAALRFLGGTSKPEAFVLITSCERVLDAWAGRTGTRIVRGSRG